MALFKISKGNASALGNQPKTEGYCWFTPDDGKFYIDVSDTTRQILNAGHADTAEKDASGNIITETYETKTAANEKLTEAKNYTDQKVAELVDSAPETLDTLKELSDALGNNENFATTVATQIGTKADKEAFESHIGNKENPHDVTKEQVGLDRVENKSAKDILGELKIDNALSNTSTNLIQNKPVAEAINSTNTNLAAHAGNNVIHITANERTAWNNKSNFSGNYNDLTNKPTIPSIDGLATETFVITKIEEAQLAEGDVDLSNYYIKSEVDEKLATKADASNIPTKLSDLEDDENHRTVTDTDKNIWNLKSQVQLIKSDNAKILSTLNIHKLTQEEYDQKVSDGTLDDDTIYLTPDEDDIDLSPYATIEQLNTKVDIAALSNYYTKSEIDNLELITVEDIDNICGTATTIQMVGGNEVKF